MESYAFVLVSLIAIASVSHSVAQSLTHGAFPVEKLLINPIPTVTQLQFYMQAVDTGGNETTYRVSNSSITDSSPAKFGFVDIFDNLLTETPDPSSNIVGRSQGIFGTSDLSEVAVYNDLNVYFTSGIYNGSTLHIAGRFPVFTGYRELFVAGGTGYFRLATGIVTLREIAVDSMTMSAVVEFNVTVVHPILA
ncbi:hypothetical protein MLD38_022982 [Melastoma candidum]|uniref:Uncharacterized protein n=1 Tax=Melastoma candidum TaxID=119954 RepID=A0ACB9QQ04_9MYRT|nr:hypothetical protein MLD38_022982 [Melastoma candidum]